MSESLSRKTTKAARWKKYQKKSQTKKKVSLAVTALSLLIGLVIFGLLISFIKSFITPGSGSKSPLASYRHYSWDGKSTFNVVIKENSTYVLSFHPADSEIAILKVPDETYLNVPYGFGTWRIGSVYELGQSENPPIGARLLKDTIETNLGVAVDGVVVYKENQFKGQSLEKVLEGARKNPFATMGLYKNAQTDLSSFELLTLFIKSWGIRTDKITFLDLSTSQITQSILLADGTRALGLDPYLTDQLIQRQFSDNRVSNEGLSIGVYNSTNEPGLADRVSRIITNMGGRVTIVSNTPIQQKKSQVVGQDSYTKLRLSQIFASECVKKQCSLNDPNINTQRTNVVVVLGEDYAQKFSSE